MWPYEAIDAWGSISLHDCRITGICVQDNNIICDFAEGYWIAETDPRNTYKKTLGTDDNSQITLTAAYCEKVEINDTLSAWDEFCTKINAGEWEFECITSEYDHNKWTCDGWVWFDDEPFHLDCRLEFVFKHIIYNWNTICADRPW